MTEKRKRGRPEKLSPEVQAKLVDALKKGNYRSTSARHAGIAYSTLRAWLDKGSKARSGKFRVLFDAVHEVETKTEVEAVGDLLTKAKSDPKLLKWWLAHRHPSRWADNRPQKLELTGKDGGPIKIDDARERLAQRLDRLAASLKKKSDSEK